MRLSTANAGSGSSLNARPNPGKKGPVFFLSQMHFQMMLSLVWSAQWHGSDSNCLCYRKPVDLRKMPGTGAAFERGGQVLKGLQYLHADKPGVPRSLFFAL